MVQVLGDLSVRAHGAVLELAHGPCFFHTHGNQPPHDAFLRLQSFHGLQREGQKKEGLVGADKSGVLRFWGRP